MHTQDDDRSSSLSDPVDEHYDDLQERGVDSERPDANATLAHGSPDLDSEAETERLNSTPQKLLKRPDSLGKTPSKLSQAATADDELSDPPSPLMAGARAASSISTVATAGTKRKRSDTAESSLTSAESDLIDSPRKRPHISPRLHVEPDDEDEEPADIADGVEEGPDDTPVTNDNREAPALPSTKGGKGVKGKKIQYKSKKAKELAGNRGQGPSDAPAEDDETVDDAQAKGETEKHDQNEASAHFDTLAARFAAFRDKIYAERLSSLDRELVLLQEPDCAHPEYLRQVECLNARLEKQMREAHAYNYYRQKALRERTLGERAQLHSQYHQQAREIREEMMERLGKLWHDIQQERRQNSQEQDEAYIFKFPSKRSEQIRQQAKYNQEVSVLSGVAKYVGFPAAPEIVGAGSRDLEDDLRKMKISKPVRQPRSTPAASTHAHPVYMPRTSVATQQTANDRIAEQQFMEQNAWARPQAPIHTHGTPNLMHTPDWAEPIAPSAALHRGSSARGLMRNLSGGNTRVGSPFGVMFGGRNRIDEDGDEAFGASPLKTRIGGKLPVDREPADPLGINAPKQRDWPDETRRDREGVSGTRNVSGLSGVSTIDAPADGMEREPGRGQDRADERIFIPAPARDRPPTLVARRDGALNGATEGRAQVGFSASDEPSAILHADGPLGTPAPLPVTTTAS